MFMQSIFSKGFLSVLLVPGFIFFKAGLDKIIAGKFPSILGAVLTQFASRNPNSWYKDFLTTTAIPNASTFGQLVMWGEFLAGAAILVGCFFLLLRPPKQSALVLLFAGLIGGVFLNLNFWLGGGWTSKTKELLNLVMIGIQGIGAIVVFLSLRKSK